MDNYKVWLKGMNDKALNEEILKIVRLVNKHKGTNAGDAYARMYEVAKAEMVRRDDA